MSTLEFIVRITEALAWPFTLLIVVVVLRSMLHGLIGNLTRFKFSEFELEFESTLQTARTLLSDRVDDSQKPDALDEISKLSPRAAILEAWTQIELCIENLYRSAFDETETRINVARKIQRLADLDIINAAEASSLNLLRSLRNQAAHEERFEISQEEALEYKILANAFVGSQSGAR